MARIRNDWKGWLAATPGIKESARTPARAALVDAVFNSTGPIASGGICCLIIGLATAWRGPPTIPAIWTLAYVALVCVRLAINAAYAREGRGQTDKDRWAKRYAMGALASAAMLGSAAGVAVALDLPTAMLVALAAIGSAGGIAGRNAAFPRLAVLQCMLLILPTAIGGFWSAEPANMLLAPTAIGFGYALLSFIRHYYEEMTALIIAGLDDAALARRDDLTGLPNRRCFEERLATLWPEGHRPTTPLAMLLIGIDHFRRYHALYGHRAGDECVREIARSLRDLLGEGELIARYSGEEFAVLLPKSSPDEALIVANRFCRAVVALGIEQAMRTDDLEVVTISIGIAASESAPSAEQLVEIADRSLFQAKRDGRNRVFPEGVETLVALQRARASANRSERASAENL